RTLAPTSKHAGKGEAPAEQLFAAPGMEAKTAVPTATWGPTASGPAPPVAPEMAWEVGPTAPSTPAPPPPTFAPSPPAYAPPPPSQPTYAPPPPSEPAYTPPPAPPAPEEEWAPAAIQPMETRRPEPAAAPIEPVSTPAGGGAAWSIVGDSKAASAEPDTGKKKSKKDKEKQDQPEGAAWQLSSGLMPGEEAGEEIRPPSTALAIAQYAVFGLGLLMVLIGVIVTLANSHVT
ncbi:MAG TPA: hypothetical protein VF956_03960, partial [Candidatus Dormibacteraeota bacterium]